MLQAVNFIKAVSADSKPIVLRGSDGHSYVTKWVFRKKENRRLINEWLAAPVLRYMGANCAANTIIEVTAQFINQNRVALRAAFEADFVNLKPGPVFASLIDESVEQTVNQPMLEYVTNLTDFHAALIADVFLCQGDKRQAIFEKTGKRQYRAKLIDNANALESTWWQFRTEPNAVFADKHVYCDLTATVVEDLIRKLQNMPRSIITNAMNQLPQSWIADDQSRLDHVVQTLWQRQRNMRFLMHRWMHGDHSSFLPTTVISDFKLSSNHRA